MIKNSKPTVTDINDFTYIMTGSKKRANNAKMIPFLLKFIESMTDFNQELFDSLLELFLVIFLKCEENFKRYLILDLI